MQFVKSLIFNLFLYLAIIFILILALPSLVLPNRITLLFGKFLANIIIFLMRFILGTKVIFHGVENLNKNKNFFVASAHQSMFETFCFTSSIKIPNFYSKKRIDANSNIWFILKKNKLSFYYPRNYNKKKTLIF